MTWVAMRVLGTATKGRCFDSRQAGRYQPWRIMIFLITAGASTSFSAAALSTATSVTPSLQRNAIVSNKQVPGLEKGMDYVKLGSSDLLVSKVCMGTMTFGEQNTLEEGMEQLNFAWDQFGINFLDTAEIYPVPAKAKTRGRTDQAVAKFLKGRKREDVILATKVAGRSGSMNWLRKDGGTSKVSRDQILESVDSSLKRLGVDYIDLLQIHWPDRYVGGLFGAKDFEFSRYSEDTVAFQEQLSGFNEVVQSGKVRYIGVSNETPYGVCSMVALAEQLPELYPRIVSIQNSYSLVVRKDFEAALAESCYHHDVALLPYSPLAGGVLSNKYANPEQVSERARLKLFPGFMDRYLGSQNEAAVSAYAAIAEEIGLTPTQLALSWCYHRDLVCSTIIGATTMEQLTENLKAYDIQLTEETLDKIHKVYQRYTDPTKAY